MENIIIAATNLYAIRGIISHFAKHNYTEAGFIFGAMMCSITYHLIENIKHPLPGIIPGIFKIPMKHKNLVFINKVFFNFDRFFAVAAILVCFRTKFILANQMNIMGTAAAGSLCLAISEFIPKKHYYNHIFVMCHGLWHIAVFHCAYLLSMANGPSDVISHIRSYFG